MLREVDVEVISNSQCKNAYGSSISARMLCAITAGGKGGKDACQGDSGGPLVSSGTGDGVTAGQNYDLVGVVSWGAGCADKDYPGVYARWGGLVRVHAIANPPLPQGDGPGGMDPEQVQVQPGNLPEGLKTGLGLGRQIHSHYGPVIEHWTNLRPGQ